MKSGVLLHQTQEPSLFKLIFRPRSECAQVETQGHHTLNWFVSSYQVAYSLDGSTWLTVTLENKTDLVG